MWETTDPDGRRVILRRDRWNHVLDRHPYIAVEPEDLLAAVGRPDARVSGRQPHEEWFYRWAVGPSHWIRVVVHYERGEGWIVTAFPRRALP
jgi:hypothetical protein